MEIKKPSSVMLLLAARKPCFAIEHHHLRRCNVFVRLAR
jgi:hypothetical protein